jgi:hypothetical protein
VRLLNAGLIGGHLALLLCAVAFAVVRGRDAALWSVLSGLVTVVFFTIGQGIQVLVADSDTKVVFAASLTSYVLRAGALAALLAWSQAWSERLAGLDPIAVASTAIAVVIGWLGVEIFVFTRLRIPSFDPPDDPR